MLIFDFEYHCIAVAMFVKGVHAPMTQNLLTSPMYVSHMQVMEIFSKQQQYVRSIKTRLVATHLL